MPCTQPQLGPRSLVEGMLSEKLGDLRHYRPMADRVRSSEENAQQGDFGEAWLEAIAAGHGILHGRPSTLDLDKADVELTLLEVVGNTYHPTVKVQVKTSIDVREDTEGNLVYDLDAKTHNVLCRNDHSIRRTLVVVKLSDDGERVRLHGLGTILIGRALWVSLEGHEPTENNASQAVTLPTANTVDEDGLRKMLSTFGVRRTTEVPDFDPWEGVS